MIKFRPATENDISLLRYWDSQPHVIASDPNDDWQWETELKQHRSWCEPLIAELNGQPIGFVQIMDPQGDEHLYWGDVGPGIRAIDIWIGEPDMLSLGYGTEMMNIALDRCFKQEGVKKILIDPLASNVRAHRFYQRLGFQFVERRQFDLDDCFVFALEKKQWQALNSEKQASA